MQAVEALNRGAVLSRRAWLAAAGTAPVLAACAVDLSGSAGDTVPGLARRLGVCAAAHATLTAGQPAASVAVSGCPGADPPGPDAVFQAASLTKPLIAFVALRLVQAGRLDLQAPLPRYLPDGYAHRQHPFADPADARARLLDQVPPQTLARLNVASLLNHSAGLPNWARGPLTPAFPAGSRWRYSGEGYLLLQAVIEAVTGQDIETVVQALAFGPLGMGGSRLRLTDDLRDRVVPGQPRGFDLRQPNAAASLYTTADDCARLLAAWWADRALLALTLAHTVPTDATLGLSWGLGWGIETTADGPCLWQWGNNPGFRAFALLSVATGHGFVLLSNSERGLALAAPLARATVPAVRGVFRFRMLG